MNETRTILVLGGTGFVGRAVVEKYLKVGWRVVIPTRAENIKEAENELELHGFNKNLFEESTSDKSLLFIFNIDLTDKKWVQINNWGQAFREVGIDSASILRIINLVGETSKSASEILKSNISTLDSVFALVRYLKSKNSDALFVNMGSVVEKRNGKNLSPYEYAKKVARRKIEESDLCDFHFIAHYIKGRGEQKMKLAAPVLWKKLKFSHRWLFGFKVSIIDVDDLAEIIYHLFEEIKISPRKYKPIEIYVTNGELIFGEIVKNLLPEDKRSIPKAVIPIWLDKIFLWLYSAVIPMIKPNNQLARRLASFAKRSLQGFKQPDTSSIFKSVGDIKRMARDINNYKVLEENSNLIVSDKYYSTIYVLKEKNKKELERIVQKALVP